MNKILNMIFFQYLSGKMDEDPFESFWPYLPTLVPGELQSLVYTIGTSPYRSSSGQYFTDCTLQGYTKSYRIQNATEITSLCENERAAFYRTLEKAFRLIAAGKHSKVAEALFQSTSLVPSVFYSHGSTGVEEDFTYFERSNSILNKVVLDSLQERFNISTKGVTEPEEVLELLSRGETIKALFGVTPTYREEVPVKVAHKDDLDRAGVRFSFLP